MKIAVFLEHDIMIRHFILSGVLKPLEKEFEVHYIFPKTNRIIIDIESLGLERRHILKSSAPKTRIQKYKALFELTWLRKMRSFPPDFRAEFLRMWRERMTEEELQLRLKQSRGLRYFLFRSWLLATVGEDQALLEFLKKLEPDIILHPTTLRGWYVDDLIRYGKRLGIPTVYLMNSWDNPSTKCSAVGSPDRLVVWGEQTKEHAMRYMGMKAEDITCLGAAQFEVFERKPKMSPDEYRQRLGIAPGARLVAYAGSSKGVNETAHLKLLDDAIEEGRLEPMKIVFRPHPWRGFPEEETYFFDVEWKHVVMDPTMVECFKALKSGSKRSVELADYEETHAVLNAIDALMSPLSTILLEAALHGKPILCLLPAEDLEENTWMSTAAQFPHFTEFFNRIDCVICASTGALIDKVRELCKGINDPDLAERLKKQTHYFVEPSDKPYSERLHDLLREIGRG